ncbi:MAG: class I SAM-dependent methyltransferase, partial [Enterococcus faecium]|nr:class I SAM-dependent methyltransferase [Enterococcus faecium]
TIRSAVEKEFSAQTHDQKLIDYGGGTGLVTLPFASRFKEVIIIDSAAGMLAMADKKIKEAKQANVRTLELDATKDLPAEKADIILLSLVLLHIPETKVILKQLSQMLHPSGKLYIVDFDKNEKIQHPKVHNGFDHEELREQLKLAGFKPLSIETFHHGKNLFMKQDASLFLAIASKE